MTDNRLVQAADEYRARQADEQARLEAEYWAAVKAIVERHGARYVGGMVSEVSGWGRLTHSLRVSYDDAEGRHEVSTLGNAEETLLDLAKRLPPLALPHGDDGEPA